MPSKKESNIELFYARDKHQIFDIYYISQSYFHLPKNTILKFSNIILLFTHTLRDIIILFHDIAALDMNLKDWNKLCHKA